MTWTAAFDSIREIDEKVNRLERVSGHDIDTLISLFAAGCKLTLSDKIEPVKIRKATVCPKCGGPGGIAVREFFMSGTYTCDLCHGRGYIVEKED